MSVSKNLFVSYHNWFIYKKSNILNTDLGTFIFSYLFSFPIDKVTTKISFPCTTLENIRLSKFHNYEVFIGNYTRFWKHFVVCSEKTINWSVKSPFVNDGCSKEWPKFHPDKEICVVWLLCFFSAPPDNGSYGRYGNEEEESEQGFPLPPSPGAMEEMNRDLPLTPPHQRYPHTHPHTHPNRKHYPCYPRP